MDLQPHLIGERVELRPLAPEDYDALYAAASDPRIWEQHPEPDRCTPAGFRRYFDGAIASRGAFVVVDRASGRVIGSSRYANFEPARRQVEIGWTFLDRAHWGGATNREMKSLMLEHAFRFVDRVCFHVGRDNRRSQRAMEKIGATRVDPATAEAIAGRPTTAVVFVHDRPPSGSPGAPPPRPAPYHSP